MSTPEPERCDFCDGRGCEDAYVTGDCEGGTCRHCDGTGLEPVPETKEEP